MSFSSKTLNELFDKSETNEFDLETNSKRIDSVNCRVHNEEIDLKNEEQSRFNVLDHVLSLSVTNVRLSNDIAKGYEYILRACNKKNQKIIEETKSQVFNCIESVFDCCEELSNSFKEKQNKRENNRLTNTNDSSLLIQTSSISSNLINDKLSVVSKHPRSNYCKNDPNIDNNDSNSVFDPNICESNNQIKRQKCTNNILGTADFFDKFSFNLNTLLDASETQLEKGFFSNKDMLTVDDIEGQKKKKDLNVQKNWKHLFDNYQETFVSALKTKLYSLPKAENNKILNVNCSLKKKKMHPYAEELHNIRYIVSEDGSYVFTRLWNIRTDFLISIFSHIISETGSFLPSQNHLVARLSTTFTCLDSKSQNPLMIYSISQPTSCPSLKDIPFFWVKSKQDLEDMINYILIEEKSIEIALDVEHHSMESYRGFVCLIQLSTRLRDYVIDPFDIFENLHSLNKITANPFILKVLHGGDSDILWLQRDFSVYVINMFDTRTAAIELQFLGGTSLKNLLLTMTNFHTNKAFQICDWRIRPLSIQHITYARADTHFLLFLYDCLKFMIATESSDWKSSKEVTASGLTRLCAVLEASKNISGVLFEFPKFKPSSIAFKIKSRHMIGTKASEETDAALFGIILWREEKARELDRSRSFVLPDVSVSLLALNRPITFVEIEKCLGRVPFYVNESLLDTIKEWDVKKFNDYMNKDSAEKPSKNLNKFYQEKTIMKEAIDAIDDSGVTVVRVDQQLCTILGQFYDKIVTPEFRFNT